MTFELANYSTKRFWVSLLSIEFYRRGRFFLSIGNLCGCSKRGLVWRTLLIEKDAIRETARIRIGFWTVYEKKYKGKTITFSELVKRELLKSTG